MKYVLIKNNTALTGAPTYWAQVEPRGWRHKISATVGFDTCSFDIYGGVEFLQELFFSGLMRTIQRFTPDGNMVIFEGYINDMTLNIPGMRAQTSMDEMWNKVRVRYTLLGTGSNPPTQTSNSLTTAASDTDSQAKYGIKYKVYSPQVSKLTSTMATQTRDVVLEQYKQPRRSANHAPGDTEPKLSISAKGFMHTLGWVPYEQTVSSGTSNANVVIAAVLASDCGQFIDSYKLATNTTAVNNYYYYDDSAMAVLQNIAAAGDSSGNRWLCYVMEDRKLYYAQANESIKYFRRLSDSSQSFYDAGWRNVPYYELRPNGYLRTSDLDAFAPDTADLAEEYRTMFVESVEWTEDSNTVALTGGTGDMIQSLVSRMAIQMDRLI